MDLMALSVFLLAVVVCSVFVFIISVHGTKEVTFEENLKASQETSSKKGSKASEAKKKAKKKVESSETKPIEEQPPKRTETPIEDIIETVEEPIETVQEELKEPVKEIEELKQSSTEATPTKKPKKKNKIKIEEVDQPDFAEIIPEVKKVQPKEPKKAKKPKEEQGIKINSFDDVKNLVIKTPLDDLEIQTIIDSLLSKQTGTGVHQESWVEASKENETKILQRQLADKDALLLDESGKVKSLTEKMGLLRHELNQLRSTQVQSQQRYVNEMEAAKRTYEAQIHQERESHKGLVVNLQQQVQFHVSRANSLQATIDNVPQMDPAVYGELDTLRNFKFNLEAELNGARGQINTQAEEISKLQMTLTQRNSELDEVRSSLKGALDKNKKLSDNLNSMEKKNSSSSGQFEELKRVNQDLEAKVKELTSMCMKQKSELSRLAEENERISDQLATYVERPRTEGQEANGNASQNGHGDNHNNHEQEEQIWHKKYLAMSQEHEQVLKEKDVILQNLNSTESNYKTQVSKLEADLEDQRAKNNELRSKNWKTVEALNSVEQNYQKLLKNQPSDSENVKASVLRDAEQSQKVFLQRLFPDLKDLKAKSHKDWLEELASKVDKSRHDQASKQQRQEVKNEPSEDFQKLEGQVKHYKSVLDETEKMLNQLQASVESEEYRWKAKLSDKENLLEKLQRENEAMEAKIAAMEPSLGSVEEATSVTNVNVGSVNNRSEPTSLTGVRFAYNAMENALPLIVEEMETKLRELQEKLAIEEADKVHLQEQLNKTLESEDLQRLQSQYDSEREKRGELEVQLAKMNQLLSTGQEALQNEQKTVEMLRQQVTTTPSPNAAKTAATTNGQDEAIAAE